MMGACRILNNNDSVLHEVANNSETNGASDRIMSLNMSYMHKVVDTTVDKIYFWFKCTNSANEACLLHSNKCQINIIKISNDF